MITIEDFMRMDIRVGRIVSADPFPEARKPAVRLVVDLGEMGTRTSSAQLTANYELSELEGRLVACVTNLPPRKIGPVLSEVLVLGFPDERGEPVLAVPERDVPPGGRLF